MELRKDYILDRWVIIAPHRGKRPQQFEKNHKQKIDICYFCPGNENTTPPEIGRIEKDGKWKIRWFENKFPAVEEKGDYDIKKDGDYFTFSNAYGKHEVIVETNEHEKQLCDLSKEDIADVLKIYLDRVREISKVKGVKYATVFKNKGIEAGTSIVHSHAQIVGLNQVAEVVKQEIEANKDRCNYCGIIDIEKNSDRRCFENKNFVAFTPYASRFAYEIWIFPKKHIVDIDELENILSDLAEILKKILLKLKELGADYNYFLHHSPDKNLHFHVEVTPRLGIFGGFEFSIGIIINSVSPEEAAGFYRK